MSYTQHNTTQHNTTQHNTTQHNTTQYSLAVTRALGDLYLKKKVSKHLFRAIFYQQGCAPFKHLSHLTQLISLPCPLLFLTSGFFFLSLQGACAVYYGRPGAIIP